MRSWTASLADVRAQITTMRTLAAESDAVRARVAPRVSAWSTTHHLDHCVKVATTVLEAIREGAPVGRRISVLGRLILQFGWIPRGRGKSPKRVFGDAVSGAGLQNSLDAMEQLLRQIETTPLSASREPVVPHPYFGGLSAAQALRFIAVHTRHHLRIVGDIERATRS